MRLLILSSGEGDVAVVIFNLGDPNITIQQIGFGNKFFYSTRILH